MKKRVLTLVFFSVIKNRWSNIATQWNSDKVFNIVGHYAAAKQNFIMVNATEIDYEDISKSSLIYQIPLLLILNLALLTDFMIL